VRHALWLVVLIRLIMPPVFSVPLLPADWGEFLARHWDTEAVSDETSANDGVPADRRDAASMPDSAIGAADDRGRPAVAGAPDLPHPTPPAFGVEDASAPMIEGAEPEPTAVAGISPPFAVEVPASASARETDFDGIGVESGHRPLSANPLPIIQIESFVRRH